jgi:catechol 2,3-dioxygenase-like lactoylglutathione lyase family enzyme
MNAKRDPSLQIQSLDFVYVPTGDVDRAVDFYCDQLQATLVFRIRSMGTTVAAVRVSAEGPTILLAGHLEGPVPILVYRVADYLAALAALRARGVTDIHELEIPHGPCAVFEAEGGQRLAVYELVRPGADDHFEGRVDP